MTNVKNCNESASRFSTNTKYVSLNNGDALRNSDLMRNSQTNYQTNHAQASVSPFGITNASEHM